MIVQLKRSRIVGTYVPVRDISSSSWYKVVVGPRKGTRYLWTWYYHDGTIDTDWIIGRYVRDDVANGYMARIPKHLIVQDGL